MSEKPEAEKPRHKRKDTQSVLKTDWRLWNCAPATGREGIVDWGPAEHIQNELMRQFLSGYLSDPWIITPEKRKLLPVVDRGRPCLVWEELSGEVFKKFDPSLIEASGSQTLQHPWADESGKVTPSSAAFAAVNLLVAGGASVSTAFHCASLLAGDIEKRT